MEFQERILDNSGTGKQVLLFTRFSETQPALLNDAWVFWWVASASIVSASSTDGEGLNVPATLSSFMKSFPESVAAFGFGKGGRSGPPSRCLAVLLLFTMAIIVIILITTIMVITIVTIASVWAIQKFIHSCPPPAASW